MIQSDTWITTKSNRKSFYNRLKSKCVALKVISISRLPHDAYHKFSWKIVKWNRYLAALKLISIFAYRNREAECLQSKYPSYQMNDTISEASQLDLENFHVLRAPLL